MDLKEELHNTSRLLADMVADAILENPDLLYDAIELARYGKHPYPMRVSRVVWLVLEKNPELLNIHFESIYQILFETKDESVRRNFLGIILTHSETMNEKQLGETIDKCFSWMEDTKQPPAVRALSMKLAAKIGKRYTELIPEIIEIIDNVSDTYTSGVKAAAKNVRKDLEKHIYNQTRNRP